MRRLLSALGVSALLSFPALLLSGVLSGPASLHWVLAVGVMPLVMGAMIHFTPVLTRSREPEDWVTRLPLLALVAGITVLGTLASDRSLVTVAAPLALAAALGLLNWIGVRARACLGPPHPGLRWYQASLVSLIIGLLAILVASFMPVHWMPLRNLHLHMNLLGFLGLAAMGTLQVLLPTVGRYPDPQAGERLRTDLKYAFVGTLLAGIGAAWFRSLSWIGMLLWLYPAARLLGVALRNIRPILAAPGSAFSLLVALIGLFLLLFAGIPLVLGWMAPQDTVPFFILVFLLPLVTGALGHLLPLWWFPPGESARQTEAQHRLQRFGSVRALLFLASGLMLAVGFSHAVPLGLAVLTLFGLQVVHAALTH
ncbi:MAG: hypothetical protein HQL56_08735 [Magnetococcales bacterium]|nr:hypothetical protein [Magnetococcales bacterium]